MMSLKNQQSAEAKYHQSGCPSCFHERPPHKDRRMKRPIKPACYKYTRSATPHARNWQHYLMRDSRTQAHENLSFWLWCAKRFGVRCVGTALKRDKAASSRRTPKPSALFSEQARFFALDISVEGSKEKRCLSPISLPYQLQ
jgi:hypothetical protein